MPNSSITVTVKFFAVFQETYGVSEVNWEIPEGTPAIAILHRCLTEHPQLEPWRSLTRFGVNLQFVTADTVLHDGDEVVLIPPVSGGT